MSKSFEENPNLHVDNEHDRDFNLRTVGKRFRVHYHNGWFTGCVAWYYNSTMEKVAYEDGTDDYFEEDDIDGVEIIDYWTLIKNSLIYIS